MPIFRFRQGTSFRRGRPGSFASPARPSPRDPDPRESYQRNRISGDLEKAGRLVIRSAINYLIETKQLAEPIPHSPQGRTGELVSTLLNLTQYCFYWFKVMVIREKIQKRFNVPGKSSVGFY